MKPARDGGAAAGRSRSQRQRVVWLLGCFVVGGIVGAAGSAVTGSDLWYLAIPVAVAIVWWFIADPTKCEPCADRGQPPRGESTQSPAEGSPK